MRAFTEDDRLDDGYVDEGHRWLAFQSITGQAAASRDVRLTSGDDVFEDEKGGSSVHVFGLAGGDDIAGRAGNDILSGGSGDDALGGGIGADLIFGGAGRDEILGGPGPDRIYGGAGQDVVEAGGGRDVVSGGLGSDFIDVGFRVRGGYEPDLARDRVVYTDVSDSTADQTDEISFFDPARDVIDLRRIDADTTAAGNQAFHFIGDTAFSGTPGELSFHPGASGSDDGVLAGDIDGDGQADLVIDVVTFQNSATMLTEDNFKL